MNKGRVYICVHAWFRGPSEPHRPRRQLWWGAAARTSGPQGVQTSVGEGTRLDLETVVPVAMPQRLQAIAHDGQIARLPLSQHMTVLVQHQPGIVEELLRRAAQIDASAASSGDRAGMQAHVERMLDDMHVRDGLADNGLERHAQGTRKGYLASKLHELGV